MQKEDQNNLYEVIENHIPKSTISTKNKAKSWKYGYDEKHDVVVISKSGQIENVVSINGLKIALPKAPQKIHKRDSSKKEQYWERFEYPKDICRAPELCRYQQHI